MMNWTPYPRLQHFIRAKDGPSAGKFQALKVEVTYAPSNFSPHEETILCALSEIWQWADENLSGDFWITGQTMCDPMLMVDHFIFFINVATDEDAVLYKLSNGTDPKRLYI